MISIAPFEFKRFGKFLGLVSALLCCVIACNGGGGGGVNGADGGLQGSDVEDGQVGAGGGGGGDGDAGGNGDPGVDVGGGDGDGGGDGGGGGGGGGGGTTSTLDPVSIDPASGLSSALFNGVSGTTGRAFLPIDVGASVTSFQVVVQSPGAGIAAALLDPDENIVVNFIRNPPGQPQQTTAVEELFNTNTLPYRTSSLDPLIAVGRYQENIFTDPPAVPFSGTVIAKSDDDLSSGQLRVNVVLFGSAAQSFGTDIIQAINLWRTIYDNIGVTVVIDTSTLPFIADGTGILPNPGIGSRFYFDQALALGAGSVNIFVGSSISATADTSPGNSSEALGIAAAIPGPAVVSFNTAVAVDVVQHAGDDGVFDNAERELLAETFAHEAGHYLGLYHVVEFNQADDTLQTFVLGDRLPDTPACAAIAECRVTGAAENLMFPTPVPGVPLQRTLTPQQAFVIHSQVIVD